MRVSTLAKYLGLSSRQFIEKLATLGVNVKSASTKLEPILTQTILHHFSD